MRRLQMLVKGLLRLRLVVLLRLLLLLHLSLAVCWMDDMVSLGRR